MYKTKLVVTLAALVFALTPLLSASEYDNIITKAYLQSTFEFLNGEKLKYAECKKKSYPTCTYVWGKPSKKDATKIKYGLAPEGKKLMVIYAQARSSKDFERVLKTYKDAVDVKGLGQKAVWSNKRKQLSFITKKNLIIHVNVDGTMSSEPFSKAKTTAEYILKEL